MAVQDGRTSDLGASDQKQRREAGSLPLELEVGRTPIHVADRPTSFFSSRRGAAPCRCIPQCPPEQGKKQAYHSYPLMKYTLRQVDEYARHNSEAKLLTEAVRGHEPGTTAYEQAKSNLCSYLPGGWVDPFRAQRHMTVNGLGYCELDRAYDVQTAREALEADPSIARVALSPGGRGFHAVIPVVPEPTTVPELQWMLEQVYRHMVCRYGALFGKMDRLTGGIEIHYLPSQPDALCREKALPLMTGAPPTPYTEERRRVVPGFGGGSSKNRAGLPLFEDTTNPASVAWRDLTRRRIQAALRHLSLPDGSRNDVWIPTGFCLVGAELEGRALYGISIEARDLFIEWTWESAHDGSRKHGEASTKFDELVSDFDLDRAQVGSLEGLYAKARAAGWDGRDADGSDQASDSEGIESGDAQDGANSAGDEARGEQGPPKRGRGRPQGSRNWKGSARQEKDHRQDAEAQAVSHYIAGLKNASSDIYWLGEYYTLRDGVWAQQSVEYYEQQIKMHIGAARGTETPLIGRLMSDCMATLQRELRPAVVDTRLLAVEARMRNFHLDSGELIEGTAFRNVCLSMDDSGQISYHERGEREFYTSSRPYNLPMDDPGRPKAFDEWLEEMVPDEETRRAVWEVLGMTILGQGYVEQRLIFLCVGARSGKGTLEKVAVMLAGGHCSFSGGPARLGAGPFANSALVGNALCILPDSPEMPDHPKSITYAQYVLGLSTIKNMTGEDPLTIEFKNGRRILSMVWPGTLWWDSNHQISKVIPAREDSSSWLGRIIPIPMPVEIDEDRRIPRVQVRFTSEVPSIAFYAIQAYSGRRRRGAFTFSPEMQQVLLHLGAGRFEHLREIVAHFSAMPGTWTTREQIRALAQHILGKAAGNQELTYLYRAAAAAGGRRTKRGGIEGFVDLCIVGKGDLQDGT